MRTQKCFEENARKQVLRFPEFSVLMMVKSLKSVVFLAIIESNSDEEPRIKIEKNGPKDYKLRLINIKLIIASIGQLQVSCKPCSPFFSMIELRHITHFRTSGIGLMLGLDSGPSPPRPGPGAGSSGVPRSGAGAVTVSSGTCGWPALGSSGGASGR